MACVEIIRMRDASAACTGKPYRCFFKPTGYVVESGARFNPLALGWLEDVNCVAWAASQADCVGCNQTTAPCSPVARKATTVLQRKSDGTGLLTINYGTSSDTLVYRLTRQSDGAQVLLAQATGGQKQISVNYVFVDGQQYTLTVNRTGQSSCPATETALTLSTGAPAVPSGTWKRDGYDTIAAV